MPNTHISAASGNLTAAATWKLNDPTSYNDTNALSETTSTVYKASSSFVPGAITVDAVGIKFASRIASPPGTFSVELYNATTAASIQTVTVNVTDISATLGSWLIFAFEPTLLGAGQSYQVRCKTSTAATVTIYRDATAANWARLLRTTTTGAPTAGDLMIIAGEHTGIGTGNDFVVTMDETAGTVYGAPSATTPSITISERATLAYGTSASTNYRLVVAGGIEVYDGGTFTIGTATSPIPASSTARLEFSVATNIDSYLLVTGGGTFTSCGTLLQNVTRALLTADVAIAGTVLTTDMTTGWKSGDQIAIAPTKRTINEGESRTLSVDASGTTVTLNSGLTYGHDGVAHQAEVVNLTRNVKIFGTSATLCAYVRFAGTATVVSERTEYYYLGSATVAKRGVTLETTGTAAVLNNCAFHDYFSTATTAIGLHVNILGVNATVSDCDFWNTNYLCIHSQFATGAITFSGNWVIGGPLSGSYGIYAGAEGTSLINNRCAGHTLGMGMVSTASLKFGTMSGNVIHSCTNGLSISAMFDSTVSNTTIWRTGGQGLMLASCTNVTIDGMVSTGNVSSSLTVATNNRCVINNLTAASESGYTQPYSIFISGLNPETVVSNSTFGGVGALAATNGDIVPTGLTSSLIFHNTNFASPTEFYISVWRKGNSYQSEKHNGIAGSNKHVKWEGSIIRDTMIFESGVSSSRIVPAQATVKLESAPISVAVLSGNSVTVTARVRKSVAGDGTAYSGNQPRLVMRANPVAGFITNTVIGTASGAAGSWETITGTTATVSENTALEFFVDCDGVAGWVNLSSITAPTETTSLLAVYKDGVPYNSGDIQPANFSDVPVDRVELGYTYQYASVTNNRTGTRRQPTVGQVSIGTAYGPADTLTGTYDGSDRWTDPGDSNVRLGVTYKANSVTSNKTGRVTVPTAATVEIGTTFNTDAAITGTYDGSARWTDPGNANVLVGVSYKANSLTNNKSGRVELPLPVTVLNGVAYGTDDATIGAMTVSIPSATLTQIAETWGRLGLDAANPLLTNQTSVTFGAVNMALTGDQTSSTLTRQ